MIITGIDPGKTGATCDLLENGDIVSLKLCPIIRVGKKLLYDEVAMRNLLCKSHVLWLEDIHTYGGGKRKPSPKSSFTFGVGYGLWRGIARGLLIPTYYVSPQKWKNKFGIKGDKNLAIVRAKEIHPTINLKPTLQCKKDSVALAEAYLIAEYGRQETGGQVC